MQEMDCSEAEAPKACGTDLRNGTITAKLKDLCYLSYNSCECSAVRNPTLGNKKLGPSVNPPSYWNAFH